MAATVGVALGPMPPAFTASSRSSPEAHGSTEAPPLQNWLDEVPGSYLLTAASWR